VATLAEIANQVNNTLTQIQTNTKDTADVVALVKADTADIKARLDTLLATSAAGFQFLGQGLYTLQELQREANAHLATQVAQNTAILCWLGILADLSCKQLRAEEAEAKQHEEMLAELKTLAGVEKLAHAREFVEYAQHQQLEARVAACCPVATPYPEPCYQSCAEPEIRRHDPRGQGWQPSFTPPGRPGGNPTGGPR
jgi:hypothetical protein